MANEVKTVMNLTAAQDKIKALEKENKTLKAAAVFYMQKCKEKDAKIERLEKSLLSAVTNLEWEK